MAQAEREEQTDERFDKKISERMEQELYEQVCAPAIRQASEAGKRYRDIRDTVRQEGKPCGWKSSAIESLVPLGGWQGLRYHRRSSSRGRAFSIAWRSVSGACAPDTAVRRLKIKQGTPWMPACRASRSAPSTSSRPSSEAR